MHLECISDRRECVVCELSASTTAKEHNASECDRVSCFAVLVSEYRWADREETGVSSRVESRLESIQSALCNIFAVYVNSLYFHFPLIFASIKACAVMSRFYEFQAESRARLVIHHCPQAQHKYSAQHLCQPSSAAATKAKTFPT